MRTDVMVRIINTSLAVTKPALPLYEAVVNSIQAIEDAAEIDGRIDIAVLRDTAHLFDRKGGPVGRTSGCNDTMSEE